MFSESTQVRTIIQQTHHSSGVCSKTGVHTVAQACDVSRKQCFHNNCKHFIPSVHTEASFIIIIKEASVCTEGIKCFYVQAKLEELHWIALDQPTYSPHLSPYDFHLFRPQKDLGGKNLMTKRCKTSFAIGCQLVQQICMKKELEN